MSATPTNSAENRTVINTSPCWERDIEWLQPFIDRANAQDGTDDGDIIVAAADDAEVVA